MTSGAAGDDASLPASSGLININTASRTDLTLLSGIGPATAQKIIDYRTENGDFEKIAGIVNVSGSGPSTSDKIKALITVDP